jgi:hypothetical protein
MANPTPSTEALRPGETALETEKAPFQEPQIPLAAPPAARPATATTLHVPGQQIDGALDDLTSLPTAQNASRAPSVRAPSALHPHTQIVFEDADFTRPPPLNYSLRTRKKALLFFWTLIILDCVCMPIALYFGLWYGLTRDQLSANAVFSISTALLGTVSIVEYFIRFFRLWKKGSSCRVIGAQRWYLDWFHWNLSVGWFFVMIELIAYVPPIPLLSPEP